MAVMKIFVTGATGVVGRRLVPMLRAAGHEVSGVTRSSSGRAQLKRQSATAVDLDLFAFANVVDAIAGHDVVINLATHIPRSSGQMFLPWAWRENDRLRRTGSATLVNGCIAAGVPRFVQESFAPVYPDRGDRWIDESLPVSPVRYNRTVADAEASAERFTRSGGVGIVLRFGGFYGPDAFQTADFITWVRRGWAPMPGSPQAYISSVSHDDAAAAAAAATTLPSGTYNVIDDRPVTHREFFESLAETIGVQPPRFPPAWITPLFGSLGEMAARSLRISNRRLREASAWAPKYASIRQGWPAVIAEMTSPQSSTAEQPRSAGPREVGA
jgi:nucleoside-diphosphate-sugar epimerase